MEHQSCPTDESLESFALDEASDVSIAQHIKGCQHCDRRLEEIRANNAFLDEFARITAFDGLSDEEPSLHVDEPIPDVLPGGYRVEGEIHRGGHGVIYRATQIRTNRVVAVKMLILGTSATSRQRVRFEREAEIVAGLRHPGIVTIYDAGYLDDGRFGFAMEFVEGVTLDRWARRHPIGSKRDIDARIRVFLLICDAVNFAHQYGVVHRDLKPANILIDRDSEPHILDFGIAKVLDEQLDGVPVFGSNGKQGQTSLDGSEHTQPGEFTGTLSYASPEQVSGDPSSIDLRTDVYSLGVLLYELLSGGLPYSVSGSVEEVIQRVTSAVPEPLFERSPMIARDLSEIVLHALEKKKQDRYKSVYDLSRDLENYLDAKPIEIRRNSAWYVVRKTVRRKWLPFAAASIALALVTGVAILMTMLYFEMRNAEAQASLELRSRNLALAHIEGLTGDGALAIDMLWDAQLRSIRGMPAPEAIRFGGAFEPMDSYWELWDFYSRNPSVRVFEIESESQASVDVSPENRSAVSYANGRLHFYSILERKQTRSLRVQRPQWLSTQSLGMQIRYGRDGQRVYALGENGIVGWDIGSGEVLSSKRLDAPMPGETHSLLRGGIAALGVGRKLRVLFPEDGADELLLDTGEGNRTTAILNGDGTLLATSTLRQNGYQAYQSTLSIWSLPSGERVARELSDGAVQSLFFASDDQSLLISNTSGTEKLRWDFTTDQSPRVVLTTEDFSIPVLWLNDDKTLVCLQADYSLSIWDMASGQRRSHYVGPSNPIRRVISLEFQSQMVSVSDQSIRIWGLNPRLWGDVPESSSVSNHDVAITRDGTMLAWAINEVGNYRVAVADPGDTAKMIELPSVSDLITSLAFSWDGKIIVSATYDGQVSLWDIEQRRLINTFRDHDSGVHSVAMSPVEHIVASSGDDGRVVLRNLDTGEVRTLAGHRKRVPKVVFRSDGRVVASCSIDGTIRLWDVDSGALRREINLRQKLHSIALSPDGTMLAAGGYGKMMTLIDLKTDKHTQLKGDLSAIYALAFGPQGRVIVSGDKAGDLSVWDVETGRRLIRLPKHEQMVMSIVIHPDGRSMVTCSAGLKPEIRIWDLDLFATHIAGNLEYQAARLKRAIHKEPANLDAMRAWADETLGAQQ